MKYNVNKGSSKTKKTVFVQSARNRDAYGAFDRRRRSSVARTIDTDYSLDLRTYRHAEAIDTSTVARCFSARDANAAAAAGVGRTLPVRML